jgi:fumarate reductase subunit D
VVAVDHLQRLLLVVLVVLVLAETGALRLEHQLQPDLHLQALVGAEVLTALQAIILVLMVVVAL